MYNNEQDFDRVTEKEALDMLATDNITVVKKQTDTVYVVFQDRNTVESQDFTINNTEVDEVVHTQDMYPEDVSKKHKINRACMILSVCLGLVAICVFVLLSPFINCIPQDNNTDTIDTNATFRTTRSDGRYIAYKVADNRLPDNTDGDWGTVDIGLFEACGVASPAPLYNTEGTPYYTPFDIYDALQQILKTEDGKDKFVKYAIEHGGRLLDVGETYEDFGYGLWHLVYI